MRRILLSLSIILATALTLQGEKVFADNKIHSIDISVELQEDGSAIVEETRNMTADDGTELYIEMNNLQDSEVSNFSVKGFNFNPVWDSDQSLEEKEEYYGIIRDGDDAELVWGMGEHGDKTYQLTYTLSNVVRNLNDGQGLLWNFDTFLGIPTEDLTLTIDSPVGLSQDNTNFWGYGFDGDIQMQGEKIVWTSEESLDDGDNVTVLLQFPSDLFNTSASVDMTLEEQREMANEGSSYNESSSLSDSSWIFWLIFGITFIPGLGIFTAIMVYFFKVRKIKRENNAMVTGAERIKMNKGKTTDVVPEYGDDIANIAFLLQELQAGFFEDYFAAYLTKWLSEDLIEIETFKSDKFFGDKYTTYIHVKDFDQQQPAMAFDEWIEKNSEDSTIEEGMWIMLLDASDSHGEIDSTVMMEWAKEHADKVTKFELILKARSIEYLEDAGYLNVVEDKVWKQTIAIPQSTPKGEELFNHITQYVAYLDDVEVDHVQEDTQLSSILVWALIGGAATRIAKQYEDILPMKKAYDDSSTTYTPTHYWHSTMHFRRNWSTGLSSGGFNSVVAGGGSGGSGGATSSGGGGGAGGGGGGGAR
jgi:uncharacterized membrane protein YgcG